MDNQASYNHKMSKAENDPSLHITQATAAGNLEQPVGNLYAVPREYSETQETDKENAPFPYHGMPEEASGSGPEIIFTSTGWFLAEQPFSFEGFDTALTEISLDTDDFKLDEWLARADELAAQANITPTMAVRPKPMPMALRLVDAAGHPYLRHKSRLPGTQVLIQRKMALLEGKLSNDQCGSESHNDNSQVATQQQDQSTQTDQNQRVEFVNTTEKDFQS